MLNRIRLPAPHSDEFIQYCQVANRRRWWKRELWTVAETASERPRTWRPCTTGVPC